MMLRRLLLLALLGTMVPLTAMAEASPPDPVWLGGYFDDNDFDDVVVLIATNAAVIGPSPLEEFRLGPPLIVAVPCAADPNCSTSEWPSNATRAPPLS